MINLPEETKSLDFLTEILDQSINDATQMISSAKHCVDSGDFFQAAVRLESLGHKFTPIEWSYFELMSGIEGPLKTEVEANE